MPLRGTRDDENWAFRSRNQTAHVGRDLRDRRGFLLSPRKEVRHEHLLFQCSRIGSASQDH